MKNYEAFLNDLKDLIAVKSVLGTPETNAPFGKGPKKALDLFLSIAKRMGFSTKEYDGYAGEVTFGEGMEIGIIGHLDVVPEGDGWNSPPYELTRKDGMLIGRGIMDDKGPSLLCLYALKELKDEGVLPKKKFRFIVGTNEETGWKDIEYLKEHVALPEYGFSPDGDFPVVYSEKGMGEVEFSLPKLKYFTDLKGGTVVNAVCGYAEVKEVKDPDFALLEKYGLSFDNGVIKSYGVSAHGSRPETGKNAILPLFSYMAERGEDLENIIDCVFRDKFGLFKTENEQGFISLSAGLVREDNAGVKLTCDLRVPAPFTFKTATDIIDKFGVPYKLTVRHDTQYLGKEDWFLNVLLDAYRKATGETSAQPIAQRGSTFARAFARGCAFGPEIPGTVRSIHAPNEHIPEEDFLKIYDVYKTTLEELSK